jgi:hypothetical protein
MDTCIRMCDKRFEIRFSPLESEERESLFVFNVFCPINCRFIEQKSKGLFDLTKDIERGIFIPHTTSGKA